MKTSVINNHIKNVAGRFAGKLYGKCIISLSRYSSDLLGYLYSCEVFRRTRYFPLLITVLTPTSGMFASEPIDVF